MTVKAGQKCTAIRRVIAPRAHVDALVAAPRATAWPRPPSATRPTRRCAWARSPASTSATRSATASRELRPRPRSSPATPDRVARRLGDAESGRLPQPGAALLRPPRAAPAVHDVEAFGPVSTVMPYDGLDEAVALARRGKGSLVASVFTDDDGRRRARSSSALAALPRPHADRQPRLAPRTSTGHGSPLPVLVHGGPGRAGGGEELGGIRARQALHAAHRRAGLAAPAHRRHRRAGSRAPTPRADGAHPFRKSLRRARDRRPASSPPPARSRSRTSSTSPTSPATPSTPTWTRRRPRRTRSSTAASPTAT